ncbi:MAG: hypothetical protein IPN68_06320 [Bacteroidetes bacterium]|nr:hypothetical protein [Bacteroidota bacterium]
MARYDGNSKPGSPVNFLTEVPVTQSSWICARRMDERGHQSHTSPVYVMLGNKPVRSSAKDAEYFVRWIDNILKNIAPGGSWNQYFTHDLDVVQARYKKAKGVYEKIALEASGGQ